MDKYESKEEATSSNSSFHPTHKSSAITHNQRAKFQELQRRRLKVQTKAKTKNKSKDNKDRAVAEDVDTQANVEDHINESLKDSSVKHCSEGKNSDDVLLSTSHLDMHPVLRKKKLHWGLDTKARWERKANM